MTIAYVFEGVHSFDFAGETSERELSNAGSALGDRASRHYEPAQVLSDDDAALVARIRTGDHDAFSGVFLKHYDGLCRFAASYTRDESDAEEIVESVFTRVWERHGAFSPAGSIGAYLYAAVRNRAINTIRDRRIHSVWAAAHAEDIGADVPLGMSMPPASMIATLEREELGVVLRRVIDTLPEHRRAVVTMRWFGGLSHAEIAAALGTSVNAVEIQLRRALKSLAAGAPAYLRDHE